MNSPKAAILALSLALGISGCTTPAAPGAGPPNAANPEHNSRNSLDWAGRYRGVLPCADCAGIETVVTLAKDGTYVAQTRYLGKGSEVFTTRGTFTWGADGNTITLSGREPARYHVGEGRLIRLANDGSRVTGALAGNYVLTKATDGITEKYWKLVELNGKPVPRLKREPFLILKADGRVTGFGGCNNFTGSYTLDEEASRIRFAQLASTAMACIEAMDVEGEFNKVLAQVDNFSLNGDRLTLNRARMAPLARLEAVYLR